MLSCSFVYQVDSLRHLEMPECCRPCIICSLSLQATRCQRPHELILIHKSWSELMWVISWESKWAAVGMLKSIQNFVQMYSTPCPCMLTLHQSSQCSIGIVKTIRYHPHQMPDVFLSISTFDTYSKYWLLLKLICSLMSICLMLYYLYILTAIVSKLHQLGVRIPSRKCCWGCWQMAAWARFAF
jgi:hypothetical protein